MSSLLLSENIFSSLKGELKHSTRFGFSNENIFKMGFRNAMSKLLYRNQGLEPGLNNISFILGELVNKKHILITDGTLLKIVLMVS